MRYLSVMDATVEVVIKYTSYIYYFQESIYLQYTCICLLYVLYGMVFVPADVPKDD